MSGAQPRKPGWIPYITADGWLLIATCGMRAFAYGFLSVMLGLYLSSQGLQAEAIGAIFTVAMAGGAATTLGLTTIADRIGRRRVLIIGAVMMVLAGVVFAVSDNLVFLFIAAGLGTINPAGGDVGPFLSIEQAILSQATTDEHRTSVFAHYNIVKSMAGALGALAVGLPTILGLAPMPGYHALLWGYVASAFILLALFFRLTPAVEAPAIATGPWHKLGLHKSHKVVAKLAALFALDSFSTGLVMHGLVAYWLYLRYDVDISTLGAIFFGARLLSAVSFLASPLIAKRFGLLNTMVFTHLPANFIIILVPLVPGLGWAVTLLMANNLLSQLDVPARMSYTMAVVAPDERSAAAGLTTVARSGAAAIAPAFAGVTLAVPALGLPFILAGTIKIIYDLSLLMAFRHVRPPEEAGRSAIAVSEEVLR